MEEPVDVASRPRAGVDNTDDLLTLMVCDSARVSAATDSNAASVSSPRLGSNCDLAGGLLGPPGAPSPTRGGRALGRAGGSLSRGCATEKVVDEEVDGAAGSRVLAITVATARDETGDGRRIDMIPCCNNNNNNNTRVYLAIEQLFSNHIVTATLGCQPR